MSIECLNALQYVRICTSTATSSCTGSVFQGYVRTTPQPTQYSACSVVSASPTDFSNSAFNITAAEGAQLSAAIVAVWALAFAVRMGIRASNVDES